jgi:hypothetical protein
VATRQAIDHRADKQRPYKGIVLDLFEKEKVEDLLRNFLAAVRRETWDDIVQQLCRTMI